MFESFASVPSDEEDLIARVRTGDEGAFEALYLAHHDGLWRFAYGYVHSRDVAEELVHDVFLSLWGTRATWEVKTRVRAWLYAAVRHLALNHLRHERIVARTLGAPSAHLMRSAEHKAVTATQVAASTMSQPQPSQLETAEAKELDDAMVRAIADLPERRRIAMTLRWKEDMSPLEIATVLGTTPEAVRVLLSRARSELAELLERMQR